MTTLMNISDIVNPESGKTFREENNALMHKYKVGNLVEIIGWDEECEWDMLRLYIVGCVRDCDDTPLYVLGPKDNPLYMDSSKSIYHYNTFSGFSEECLKLIK